MDWKFEENTATCDGKCTHNGTEKKVIITEKAEKQIRTMLKNIPKLEWMAILKGTEEGNNIKVTGIELPEQEATKGHIEVTKDGSIQAQEVKDKIGWIHSHNNMQAFFSQNDKETASQHRISIVINNKLETKGLIKETRPCGTKALEEIEIRTEREMEDDEEILKEIKEKVKEKEYKVTSYTWDGYGFKKEENNRWKGENTEAWEKYWNDMEKRPKGMPKKQWKEIKKAKKEEQLEALEGKSKGWTGECQYCMQKITEDETAVFKSGLLYHEVCADMMEIRKDIMYEDIK